MNGELKISLSEPVRNVKKLKAIITFRQLEVIDISGAVRIKGINAIELRKTLYRCQWTHRRLTLT